MLASRHLPFSSDRSRLLPPDDPRQVAYETYRSAFPAQEREVVVVLEGLDPAGRLQAANRLAASLSADPAWFENALGSLRISRLPRVALYAMSSTRRADLLHRLAHPQVSWAGQLEQALEQGSRWRYRSPLGPPPVESGDTLPMTLGEGDLVLVQVTPAGALQAQAAMERLEGQLADLRSRCVGLSTQVAGEFAVRTDDAASTRRAALVAVGISLVLVKLLFWRVFGSSRHSTRALLAVAVGMAWATGFAALTVGHLNLITVNFLATLVGLGMDFALQLIYRYEEEYARAPAGAWPRTWARAGRENLLGAAATALAFWSLCLTDFRAIAELGWIAGWGVLLCWLSTHLLLPLWTPAPQGPPVHLRLAGLSRWEVQRRGPVLAVSAVLLLLALWGCRWLHFDANLLHMARPGALSIESEAAFQRLGQRSVLFAVDTAPDEATLRRREAAFRALPQVAETVSLQRLLPEQTAEVARILELARRLQPPPRPHRRSAEELLRLKARYPGHDGAGPGPVQDALFALEQAVYQDVSARLAFLHRQDDHPLTLSELPPALRDRLHSDRFLIQIYARADLWDKSQLDDFLAALRQVDPQVTGMPSLVQGYLDVLSRCYLQAGRNALVSIVLLLLVYFRSLRKAAWALLPKLLGGVWMFGAMGWLGIPLNPANATALPLTLGVGLVFGVHVTHRLLDERGRLFDGSTGAAVLVSGLSTICGYAALITVPQRGVASLGVVMAIGVGANLIAALVVLPALLSAGSGRGQLN